MSHTKGPWLISNNGKKGKQSPTFRIWRTDPNQPDGMNNGYACIAPHVSGEANARLIAAAPDLLEALQGLLDLHVAMKQGLGAAAKKSIAAIAKATQS